MGFTDMSSPWDMRTSFWAVGIIAVVGMYVYPIAAEYLRRSDEQEVVAQRWVAACALEHDAATCETTLDAQRSTCFPRAKVMLHDSVVYSPGAFFECMNQRNSAGIVLSVPKPEPWERRR